MKIKFLILSGFLFFMAASSSAIAEDKKIIEAETGKVIGSASKLADGLASKGSLVRLTKPGDGIIFSHLPVAGKLAIRYSSLGVGLINVTVNNQLIQQLNIHSSGDLAGSFLHAIIDIKIPANATLTISLATNDSTTNIDQIIVGDGDLGLPPDIWNLPPLPVADGPYPADWKGMSRIYTAPEWWRDAKFGAWAHWDPQSMPEHGDWYARGMYQEGSPQYRYHTQSLRSSVGIRLQGHLSQLGD